MAALICVIVVNALTALLIANPCDLYAWHLEGMVVKPIQKTKYVKMASLKQV